MEKVHNHNMMKTNQEKDKKIIENQAKYNPAMVNQTKRDDESGGDTDVLENSDQEVTAVNFSSKSDKVVLLAYSGKKGTGQKKELDKSVLKELRGKVSLAKTLNFDALCKAVTVKLAVWSLKAKLICQTLRDQI